jgi:hypothetical protein
MQKVVIEIEKSSRTLNAEPNGAIEIASMMQNVEFFRVIYFLRQTAVEFSIIIQVKFLGKGHCVDDLPFLNFPWIDIQILDFNTSNEIYTMFVKGNPPVNSTASGMDSAKLEIFPLSIDVINGKSLLTFLTNLEDISKFIEARKSEGFDLRVLSVTKARLPIGSPLDSLTGRQLMVLKESYYSGYYDIPRKINSDQVAKKLGIANSTFVTSIRRAEKRIMDELFKSH